MSKKNKKMTWLKKGQYAATALVFMLGIADAVYLIFWYGKEPVSEQAQLGAFALQMTDATGAVARVVNGVFEGDRLRIRTTHTATGDLNGDGLMDAALIAQVNSQESGNHSTLFLLLNTGHIMVNTDKKILGDSVGVTALSIENGAIEVDYLDRAPDEPTSVQPHVPKKHSFQLRGVRLEQTL